MRGTLFIVTDQIYRPANSHAVPARSFGKVKTKSTTVGRRSVSPGIESFLESWPYVSRCTET
jgi:hypothetical protein